MDRRKAVSGADDLRTKAARRASETVAPRPAGEGVPSPEEQQRLVQELRLHQIELEMQNEELRRAQADLEESRARYFELYDLAPVGYLTLSERGLILEANLTAATLLGVARAALVGRPFSGFVLPEDADDYHIRRTQLTKEGTAQSWDLRMTRDDGASFWAHLEGALAPNRECRITLQDISERKRAEASIALADQRLRQSQKAESLGRMAGAIAHHFNNKLHAVIVNAREEQIPQLLMNLVTNAGDAIGNGAGAVRLAVTTVSAADIPEEQRFPVDWEPKHTDHACLEVADTGRGMGLSVVLGIVRAHDGAVSVKSQPGRGSTFRVFLPLFLSEAPPPRPATELQGGGTVLLVEDEDLVRNVASAMLRGLGFAVLDASGGSEAVAELGKHPAEIRLVLCDLSMPGMNGWETLTALRALVPGIPAILSSGYDRAQVMAGHHPELPQAFLRKPYRLGDLSEAIRLALGAMATPG